MNIIYLRCMTMNHIYRYILLFCSLCSFALIPLNAGSLPENNFIFYRGLFTDSDLLHIFFKQDTEYMDSNLYVLGLNKKIDKEFGNFSFEKEGHLGIHRGIMKHIEMNALMVARYSRPAGLPVSFGIGEGLSIASRNPDLENKRRDIFNPYEESEYSNKLLNYLMFEMVFHPPGRLSSAKPFIRVHHRSGVYGVYCPPTCGSNFISYGVRVSY